MDCRDTHSFPTRRSSDLCKKKIYLPVQSNENAKATARWPGSCTSNTIAVVAPPGDPKSTRLNSSHDQISYAVFCSKKTMSCVTSSSSHHWTRSNPRAPDI